MGSEDKGQMHIFVLCKICTCINTHEMKGAGDLAVSPSEAFNCPGRWVTPPPHTHTHVQPLLGHISKGHCDA